MAYAYCKLTSLLKGGVDMGYYGPWYSSYGYCCPPAPRHGSGFGFALIVVLVILLIILGASWFR
ncbi:YjcZ family sporulation protein [Alkalihalobacillus deserti]|uniref:YjcZ family sporulation protein n=1 Tax=Alkalihalobacillus deserti TaxID=2879466 RepID=UPI0027E09EED|nr:YjcZ family sporulation protein [Alkalihalobacillus deserti]